MNITSGVSTESTVAEMTNDVAPGITDEFMALLRTLGRHGKILLVGQEVESIANALKSRGSDVVAAALPSCDFISGTVTRLPWSDDRFESVVVLEPLTLDGPASEAVFGEVRRVAAGFVGWLGLSVASLSKGAEAVLSRALNVGFRRHPLSLSTEAARLGSLVAAGDQPLTLLEKIPARVLQEYPHEVLQAERGLHMDMSRETGRRADAHLARYTFARSVVGAESRVLDVACGSGYGAPILRVSPEVRYTGVDCSDFAVKYANANFGVAGEPVSFRTGDATRMEFAADKSYDVAVAFEAIEHLVNPDAFLRELHRVLTPSGHLVLSASNRGGVQDGSTPAPGALHVFDHGLLLTQLGRYFTVEKLLRQNDALRTVPDNQPSEEDARDAESWIVVARPKELSVSTEDLTEAVPVADKGQGKTPERVVVLDEPGRLRELYGDAFERLGVTPIFAGERSATEVLALHPQVVVLSREWTQNFRLIAAGARAQGIPVIYVTDGVLEWSYLWNNLSHIRPGGTMLQPMLATDLCAIGQHPARIFASMGLGDRVHAIGLPRLDHYDRSRQVVAGARPRILIATARTAGHDTEQQISVRRALRDLKAFFDAHPLIEVTWRIAADLAEDIEVTADVRGSMSAALSRADALITCPSTCALEGMLKGIPVAQLEYRPVPLYVASAWEIRSADHIPNVIQQLLHPPTEKLAWQDACVADELEPIGGAGEKLATLIRTTFCEGRPATGAAPAKTNVGRLDFRQIHSELSIFAAAPASALQYELDATHALLRKTRTEQQATIREAIELGEAALGHDIGGLRVYSFLDRFSEAQVNLQDGPASASPVTVTVNQRTSRALLLHPPAAVQYAVPSGESGVLSFAVGMHPEVWNQPDCGPCRFLVRIDGAVAHDITIDVRGDEAARRWFWCNVPVAAAVGGAHVFEFVTESSAGYAFRWALWRNPMFIWAAPSPTDHPAFKPAPARRPDYYEAGRSVA